jgi:hypothetical protein
MYVPVINIEISQRRRNAEVVNLYYSPNCIRHIIYRKYTVEQLRSTAIFDVIPVGRFSGNSRPVHMTGSIIYVGITWWGRTLGRTITAAICSHAAPQLTVIKISDVLKKDGVISKARNAEVLRSTNTLARIFSNVQESPFQVLFVIFHEPYFSITSRTGLIPSFLIELSSIQDL